MNRHKSISFSIVFILFLSIFAFSGISFAGEESFWLKPINEDKGHKWHFNQANLGGWLLKNASSPLHNQWAMCAGDAQLAADGQWAGYRGNGTEPYFVQYVGPGESNEFHRNSATGNGGYYPASEQGTVVALLNTFSEGAKNNILDNAALSRAEDYIRLGENIGCTGAVTCKRTDNEVENRAKEMLREARRIAGPYAASVNVKLNTDERGGFIENVGLKAKSGNGPFVGGHWGKITISGPAHFAGSPGKTTHDFLSTDSPQKYGIDVIGNGTVNVKVEFTTVPNSYAVLSQSTWQNLITRGIPDRIFKEARTHPISISFQPEVTSTVPKRVLEVGDSLQDTLVVKPKKGEKWVSVNTKDVPLKMNVDVYGPFDSAQPRSKNVPDGVTPISSKQFTVVPKNADEAVNGVVVQADMDRTVSENGYYTFVARIIKDEQGEFAKYVKADFVSDFFDPAETSVLPFVPGITSQAMVSDDGVLSDTLFVNGFPEDHGAFKGLEGFSSDKANIVTGLYCLPDDWDNVLPHGRPLREYTSPATNGTHVIGGDVNVDDLDCYDTLGFVSTFEGDDRVISVNTPATDKKEQIPPKPLVIKKSLLTDAYDGDKILTRESKVSVPGVIPVIIDGNFYRLRDVVTTEWGKPGKVYRFEGVLKNPDDGSVLATTSVENTIIRPVTGKKPVTDTILIYELPKDMVLPDKGVSTIKVYDENNVLVAEEDNLYNLDQTVNFPRISTFARDKADGDKYIFPEKDQHVIDTVTYNSFIPNEEYELEFVKFNASTNTFLEQTRKKVKYVPTGLHGEYDFEYVIDASRLGGNKLVSFVVIRKNGNVVAWHMDAEDESQTIRVPSIITFARDNGDGDNIMLAKPKQTIKDILEYAGLEPNKEFSGVAWLTVKSDERKFSDIVRFTLKTGIGEGQMSIFYKDLDLTGMDGESLVSNLEIRSDDGILVLSHVDNNNDDQTVRIGKLVTFARDKADGDKFIEAKPNQIIVDTQKCSNIPTNVEYKFVTWQEDRKTRTRLTKDKVTMYTPTDTECKLVVESNPIDMTGKDASDVVTLVKAYDFNGNLVIEHVDYDNKDQIVSTPPKPLPNTGSDVQNIVVMAVLTFIIGVGISLVSGKKRGRHA